MNKSIKGFTLIELLVVIAIIGLLSTVIAGPINNARNKGKDAKKVADIKNMQAALAQYADANGFFPATLDLLAPQFLDALPRNTLAAYTPQMDKYMYVTYADANGVRYGYHLAVKLSVSNNPALDSDADCTHAAGGTACMSPTAPTTISVTNFTAATDLGAPATNATDFTNASVVDTSATVCTSANTTCIYDVRGTI